MARVVNEKRFKEATCTCYKIDQSKGETPENLLCYKPGGIGVLSNKQDRECMDMVILPTPPILEFHFQKFEIAGKEILAECMKYDNEEEFRACIRKQAEKRGMTYVSAKEKPREPEAIPEKKTKEEKKKKSIFDEKGRLIVTKKQEPEKKKETPVKQKPEKKQNEKKPEQKTAKANVVEFVEPGTEPEPQPTPMPIEKKPEPVKPPVKPEARKSEPVKASVKKGTLSERLKANPGRISIKEFVKNNPDVKKAEVEKTITGFIATGTATAIDDDVVYLH